MRQKLWLFAGMILIWTSMVQASELEIITSPLRGRGTTCLVTNVGDAPVDVVVEVFSNEGLGYGGGNRALALLQTLLVAQGGFPVPGLVGRVCRVTSDAAKKGDLKVTFCVLTEDGACQAAVTTE